MESSRLCHAATEAPALEALLLAQQQACLRDPMPHRDRRIRWLDTLHNALIEHREAIIAAVSADFSNRAAAETELAEMMPLLEGIAYYRKRLRRVDASTASACVALVAAGTGRSTVSTTWCGRHCGALEFSNFSGLIAIDRCAGCG